MLDNMIGYQADKNIISSKLAHCNGPTLKGKNRQTRSSGGGGALLSSPSHSAPTPRHTHILDPKTL